MRLAVLCASYAFTQNDFYISDCCGILPHLHDNARTILGLLIPLSYVSCAVLFGANRNKAFLVRESLLLSLLPH